MLQIWKSVESLVKMTNVPFPLQRTPFRLFGPRTQETSQPPRLAPVTVGHRVGAPGSSPGDSAPPAILPEPGALPTLPPTLTSSSRAVPRSWRRSPPLGSRSPARLRPHRCCVTGRKRARPDDTVISGQGAPRAQARPGSAEGQGRPAVAGGAGTRGGGPAQRPRPAAPPSETGCNHTHRGPGGGAGWKGERRYLRIFSAVLTKAVQVF